MKRRFKFDDMLRMTSDLLELEFESSFGLFFWEQQDYKISINRAMIVDGGQLMDINIDGVYSGSKVFYDAVKHEWQANWAMSEDTPSYTNAIGKKAGCQASEATDEGFGGCIAAARHLNARYFLEEVKRHA